MSHTATYSPDDNKLRMYPAARLDKELFDKFKAAGYIWAPKQQCFIAPMWTPGRYDLLLSVCGEVGDEDKSLMERAEDRAERFEGYSDNRASDSANASKQASAIADCIPFGQPILVGHHSEGRARRDAARIQNGFRKAVENWDTAQYWKRRAAAAVNHAAYKALPNVRHRRIKTIEADQRKRQREIDDANTKLALWNQANLTPDQVLSLAGVSHLSGEFPLARYPRVPPASQYEGRMSLYSALEGQVISAEQAIEMAKSALQRQHDWAKRWVDHYELRLTYERAMLGEQGGLAADKFDIQVGGQVLVRGDWETVVRLNKKSDVLNSVSTKVGRGSRVRPVVEIKDYTAPTVEQIAKIKDEKKLPPLLNYAGEGVKEMTSAEYKAKHSDYKAVRGIAATETRPQHRARFVVDFAAGGSTLTQVFLTDAKVTDKHL